MPGTALCALQILNYILINPFNKYLLLKSFQQNPIKQIPVINPILQMKRLRHREVWSPGQGHTAGKWRARCGAEIHGTPTPLLLAARFCRLSSSGELGARMHASPLPAQWWCGQWRGQQGAQGQGFPSRCRAERPEAAQTFRYTNCTPSKSRHAPGQ